MRFVNDQRDLGEAGLAEALDRLRQRLADRIRNPIISLGEALEWCYALECYHVDRLGWSAFEGQRRGRADGEMQAALSWARGLFTHHLVATASLVDVLTPSTWRGPGDCSGGRVRLAGGLVSDVRWKQRSALPTGKSETHGRDSLYDKHVASQPVMAPLNAAADFLRTIP
jgi:hypothetical protein